MKKTYSRLVTFLLAFCMVGSLLSPVAKSADTSNGEDDVITPRSAYPVVAQVIVYPALVDSETGSVQYTDKVKETFTYRTAAVSRSAKLTAAETAALISKFKEGTGVEPNGWAVTINYLMQGDGHGSYPKSLEIKPWISQGGSCVFPKLTDGVYKVKLRTSTSDYNYALKLAFTMPNKEATSREYVINSRGQFTSYNGVFNKTEVTPTNVSVVFNSDIPLYPGR